MGKNSFKKFKKGYTIIETLIAISIFLVIMTAGLSTLLTATATHQKSQDIRSIVDSMTFIMEEMSKNLRTGYDYRCVPGVYNSTNADVPQSCASGGAIAFENAYGDNNNGHDQWVYKVESSDGGVTYNIFKSIDSGETASGWVQLNPSEVNLNSVSGFSVLGATPPSSGDNQQPLVIIKMVGSITFKNVVTPFSLQTSVSQRLIDI